MVKNGNGECYKKQFLKSRESPEVTEMDNDNRPQDIFVFILHFKSWKLSCRNHAGLIMLPIARTYTAFSLLA